MSTSDFSSMELAALKEIASANPNFPQPDLISFESREQTPCGRYVSVSSSTFETLDDGYYDMGGRVLNIESVPNGAMAVARASNGRIVELELTTYGGVAWDGNEEGFSIT